MKATGIALVLVAVCAVAISGCSRKYTATATVGVAYRPLSNPHPPEASYDGYRKEQMEMLVSKSVMTAALREPEVASLPSVQAETESGVVNVTFPSKANIITVSCTMRDPHEAAVLTNAIVDAYVAEVRRAKRKLQDRYESQENRVNELERELNDKLRAMEQIVAGSPGRKAKVPSTPGSQDAAGLRTAVDSLKLSLHDLADERDKIGLEIKSRARITAVDHAQEPTLSN